MRMMSLTTQYNKSYQIFLPTLSYQMFVQKIKILAVGVPEKYLTKFDLRERNN